MMTGTVKQTESAFTRFGFASKDEITRSRFKTGRKGGGTVAVWKGDNKNCLAAQDRNGGSDQRMEPRANNLWNSLPQDVVNWTRHLGKGNWAN